MGLHKGRKNVRFYDFMMLGRDMVLHCDEWKQLSPSAKVLYLCIKAKHNGTNNGQILLHYSELREMKGFRSDETISKAFAELEKKGWLQNSYVKRYLPFDKEMVPSGLLGPVRVVRYKITD